jgi:2-keto-3-deoxy-6-phosphogluconate aldolase
MSINELLADSPVVPLVQADNPAVAVKISRALAARGLKVAEVVFRTDRVLECVQAVADEVPEMIASVFRTIKFMPTGGISAANLGEFLAVPSVLACGGSWLTPEDAVAAGDFEKIASRAAEAVDIARSARG